MTETSDVSDPCVSTPPIRETTEQPFAAQAEGLTLQGTLTLPAGASSCAKVPAVVLVHGSGPQSRHSKVPGQLNMMFGFELPIFDTLARELAAQGIASVRYDKRTCGPFNGRCQNDYPIPSGSLTMSTFATDALAVAKALSQRPEISGIFYVGHSQGGQLGPKALSLDTDRVFAGAILLAPSHMAMDQSIATQLEASRVLAKAQGAPPADIEQALAPLVAATEQLQALRAGTLKTQGLVAGAHPAFWLDAIAVADTLDALVATEDRPLLAVFGQHDRNVPQAEEEAWRAGFKGSPGGAVRQVEVLDELSHALNKVAFAADGFTPTLIERDVDPRVPSLIAAFVTAHTP